MVRYAACEKNGEYVTWMRTMVRYAAWEQWWDTRHVKNGKIRGMRSMVRYAGIENKNKKRTHTKQYGQVSTMWTVIIQVQQTCIIPLTALLFIQTGSFLHMYIKLSFCCVAENLTSIVPLLADLSKSTRVLWMLQGLHRLLCWRLNSFI